MKATIDAFLFCSHVSGSDAHPVLGQHALRAEVLERGSFLHVPQHGRIVDAEPAIRSATAAPIGDHVDERVLVDLLRSFVLYLSVVPKQ